MPERIAARRRRRRLLLAVPVVVVLGAALRFGLSGWPADVAGGLAYTVLIYLLVGAGRPSWRPALVAAVAVACSCAVELAQLTGGPQALVDWWSPMRLAVGQSFSAADLPVYVVGGLLAALVDGRTQSAAPTDAGGDGEPSRRRSRLVSDS